ncbi:hypothetical protein [Spiroplasma cantharicola]|uniref:Uncharacterized protein n=1 Tax=Spiroplasma cantharicola TaxID=362837 RepID=A0A0M4JT15_9MOLU|nr:hypothetical protein [Spiroplasma cantharicola]ALD66621.1 hypothetical protein SCANT_v1c07150 [Spiroplasma cantharicola]
MYIINFINGSYCVINTLSNLLVAKFIKLEDATNFVQAANTINFGFPNNINKFYNPPTTVVTPIPKSQNRVRRVYNCCSHGQCNLNHNNVNNTMAIPQDMSKENKELQEKLKDLNNKINSVIEEKTAILNENEILKSIIVNSDDEEEEEILEEEETVEEEDETFDDDDEEEESKSQNEESIKEESEVDKNKIDEKIIASQQSQVELDEAEKAYLNRQNIDEPKSKKELKRLKKEEKNLRKGK